MPCYSFSNNTALSAGNIEIVYTASGTTYSYNNLAWICEFPISSQLKVYTRANEAGSETLKILNTDYTISGTDIVFTSAPTGQVVIRRSTPSEKMLITFQDGAKLTADQLNTAFHQLLFVLQEKDLSNSYVNYNYSISSVVPAWSGETAYVVGNIVSEGNSIYRCIAPTTNNQPPNATYWTLVNPSQAGFVLTGNTHPISINVNNLAVNKALVWNGTEFTAAQFTGTTADLTDLNITSPADKALLRYDNASSKWIDFAPTVDLSLNNLVFVDRTFYNSSITQSYTNGATAISAPSLLNIFKNASNQWVLTDPPTVYHIISELTPGNTAPETWFNTIDTSVNNLSQTLSNPVKAKLYWNLRTYKSNIADASNEDTLDNYKTLFYGAPDELYSPVGYSISAAGPIKFHGVNNGSITYKDNPYYYSTTSGGTTVFKSKLEGYGIRNFYLSVPECVSSPFIGFPVRSNDFYVTDTETNITTNCNAIGNETDNTYRDYYLLGLKDLAFAGVYANSVLASVTSSSAVKDRTRLSRYLKTKMIRANYQGFATINFKRLESSSESALSVLWKIPNQIIYYNVGALGLANTSNTQLVLGGDIGDAFAKTTRFNGSSRFHQDTGTFANSSLTTYGMGTMYKGDSFWERWCSRWSADGNTYENYQFLESDIEWMAKGVTSVSSTVNLFDTCEFQPPATSVNVTYKDTLSSKYHYPWPYRSLDPRGGNSGSGFVDYIGTHLLNIDANTLFSTANSFIPDPVDEYVYRVVLNKELTNVFKETNITSLKSAIILEYGFSERTFNRFANTALTNLNDIFKNPEMPAKNYRALSRLKASDIQVYVKSEQVETVDSNSRVVITLGIKVPRLKSIGYAKVFRKLLVNEGNTFFQRDSTSSDTEIDSGPWNFGNIDQRRLNTLSGTDYFYSDNSNSRLFTNEIISVYDNLSGGLNTDNDFISGRNECAVKFTRLGIPSTLWIRMSVLNTNGSADLLNAAGFIVSEVV